MYYREQGRNMTIQGAIFDCDGLLADTETPDYEAWLQIYADHGLPLTIEAWAESIGTAKGDDRIDWHAALAKKVGSGYDREAIQRRKRHFYRAAIAKLHPLPGVVTLLKAFAQENIPCAVASNSDRVWVEEVLQIVDLRSYFAAIATADEVANPKPAPDVYLLAAERIGVLPNHCAAFEDSPRGLAAAHAAGMVTVAVPTHLTRHLDYSQAHHLVESLEQITAAQLQGKLL